MRVFLVENHDDTRFLFCLLLEQSGYEVVAAASMTEALHRIPGAGAQVLISDIGLPDGDGWQLMQLLGADRPPYALAMSGFGMSGDRQRSLAAGFRHHLVKPVEPGVIERLIEEAVQEAANA